MRNIYRSLFIAFAVSLAGASAFAQRYPMQVFVTSDGLPGMGVNALAQDSSGYLWVGTNDGLARFDGLHFKLLRKRDGLASEAVSAIAADGVGRVWVAHQTGGISVIKGQAIRVISEREGLANNQVQALCPTPDGAVWAGTFDGISIITETGIRNVGSADGLPAGHISAIGRDSDGRMWAGTFGHGLAISDGQGFKALGTGQGLPDPVVTSLMCHRGRVLVTTMAGAATWDGKRLWPLGMTGIKGRQVAAAAYVGDDLWLASSSGLHRLRDGKLLTITERNGLPSNDVRCLLPDREGGLWVGTDQGLAHIPHTAISYFFADNDLPFEPASLFRDSKGRLWAANAQGGPYLLEGGRFTMPIRDPDLNAAFISAVAEDRNGHLWFGTKGFGGLFEWDGKKVFNYSDEFGLADNNINCLTTARNGILWIGTPSGLSAYDGSSFEAIRISDEFSTNSITALLALEDGAVVTGSLDGTICELRDAEVRVICPSDSIVHAINSLGLSPLGIHAATEGGGVALVAKDGWVRWLDARLGLTETKARSAAWAGNALLIGTSRGLFRARPMEDGSFRIREIRAQMPERFNEHLPGSILSDGETVWTGTAAGVMRVSMTEIPPRAQSPKLVFTGLQLFYRDVEWQSEFGMPLRDDGLPEGLSLSFRQNYLRFQFKALTFISPEKVRYRWMLEGFEKEWGPETEAASANYPNLPYGRYVLRVKACSADGVCSEEGIAYAFRIRPPFYYTWWFMLLALAGAAAGFFGFVKWRERSLKEEKKRLEGQVADRTAELREQKEIVEEQNRHITESIAFARNIQMAVLPSEEEMGRAFREHFVLYRPKETVGGDFYWVYMRDGVTWAAAVDCTGHGVAGAFMSMIGSDLLNQIVIEKHVDDPAAVLMEMDKGIKLAFAQSATEFEGDKGMDVCLVRIDRQAGTVTFAGAQRPLYVLRGEDLTEVEGDRCSVSSLPHAQEDCFTNHELPWVAGTRLFLFSDGFADQFGGSKGKKFMTQKLKQLLISCHDRPLTEQKAALVHAFDSWKGAEFDQVDDVMVMGIGL